LKESKINPLTPLTPYTLLKTPNKKFKIVCFKKITATFRLRKKVRGVRGVKGVKWKSIQKLKINFIFLKESQFNPRIPHTSYTLTAPICFCEIFFLKIILTFF
jgi:hypothetical protein